MGSMDERLAAARRVARHPRLAVTDIEARLGTRYTVDTMAALIARFPRTRFVWLMGADGLAELPRWDRWPQLFRLVPIAIFDRPSYSQKALCGSAASRFARYRVAERHAGQLADHRPPAWVFFHSRLHGASATAIRERRETGA